MRYWLNLRSNADSDEFTVRGVVVGKEKTGYQQERDKERAERIAAAAAAVGAATVPIPGMGGSGSPQGDAGSPGNRTNKVSRKEYYKKKDPRKRGRHTYWVGSNDPSTLESGTLDSGTVVTSSGRKQYSNVSSVLQSSVRNWIDGLQKNSRVRWY